MRFATVRRFDRSFAAVHGEHGWHALADAEGRPYADLGAFLADGATVRRSGAPLHDAELRFLAPVRRPPKIVAVGLNYRAHAAEQGKQPPERPMLFSKASNIVVGPEDIVRIPPSSGQVDFEVELGVVIGRAGIDVPEARALDHVFGFTIVNDVTSREAQNADKQFYRGKSFDTFCPCGPVVVTPDEFAWSGKRLWLSMNGALMQESVTTDMIFTPPFLVAYVSAIHGLEAGDLIATGTPSGVLMYRPEKRFLQPGDVTEAGIEGIGVLRNAFQKR